MPDPDDGEEELMCIAEWGYHDREFYGMEERMTDNFRFSRATAPHGNEKCCGKKGCTNVTEQCELQAFHKWQIKKAGGAVTDAVAYPRTHPGRRRDHDQDQTNPTR